MTPEQLCDVTLHLLGEIAPEAALHELAPDTPLREALALDSFDFLHFVIAVHETFHVDVPESDYPQLATLRGCVEYLARTGAPGASRGASACGSPDDSCRSEAPTQPEAGRLARRLEKEKGHAGT